MTIFRAFGVPITEIYQKSAFTNMTKHILVYY